MWELDCEEGWGPKNWCFWTVVLKTLESPLDCKEIQPVHSEGDQPWDFFGRNDAKAEFVMDREAWRAAIHEIAKSRTRLSDWTELNVYVSMLLFQFVPPSKTSLVAQTVKCLSTNQETHVQSLIWEDPLEKEMAIHFSTIAWKIPWTEEPGRLLSMGSQRVRHDWVTSLQAAFRKLRK